WRDRISALRVGLALRRLNGDRARLGDITVREWLTELGQTGKMQHRFWDLVALATLNEQPERASADMFARVLDQAFMHTRRDSTMVISRVGLSDLYTDDARRFITARGGEVRLNAPVASLDFENGRAAGVTLRSGERIAARTVISAVPQFQSAPIVSINLWYDEPVTDLEFVGLLDSRIEWVFNKNAIAGESHKRRQHLALVISGAHEVADWPKERLVEMATA